MSSTNNSVASAFADNDEPEQQANATAPQGGASAAPQHASNASEKRVVVKREKPDSTSDQSSAGGERVGASADLSSVSSHQAGVAAGGEDDADGDGDLPPSDEEEDGDGGSADQQQQADNPKKAAKPAEPLHFIPWQFLTYRIMKQCMTAGNPRIPKDGTSPSMKLLFDYAKFRKLCPECPAFEIEEDRTLVTNFPLLVTAFGYSPYLGKDGKVTSQLRFLFNAYANENSRRFQGPANQEEEEDLLAKGGDLYGIRAWDKYFCEMIHDKLSKGQWATVPVFANIIAASNEPTSIPLRDVVGKWKKTVRNGKDYPNYVQFKLKTQYADHMLGLPSDPYTAHLLVWDASGKCVNESGKLTKKNGCKYTDPDRCHVFTPGMYAEGIWYFSHLNAGQSDFGLTGVCTQIKIYSEDQALKSKQNKQKCPLG